MEQNNEDNKKNWRQKAYRAALGNCTSRKYRILNYIIIIDFDIRQTPSKYIIGHRRGFLTGGGKEIKKGENWVSNTVL